MKDLLTTQTRDLSDDQLSSLMLYLNDQYRLGTPLVSDAAFDFIYMPALQARIPDHPLITKIQPESLNSISGRYKHQRPMLSTLKAYEHNEIQSFIVRCEKAAKELGINDPLLYRISPKLDGMAASFIKNGNSLYSRGDGIEGNNISHLLTSGLKLIGDSSKDNVGEIVVSQDYFENRLKEHFTHPRSLVSGLAGSKTLSQIGLQALNDGAIHLVFFNNLTCPTVSRTELLENLDFYCSQARKHCEYATDGTVIEIINEKVKKHMHHNGLHHLWQIAKKEQSEVALVPVHSVEWQVGRRKITPVLNIEPTFLSGAVLSRVTAHHAGNVKSLGLGKGAIIELTRAGEVISKINRVEHSVIPQIPTHCPCCNTPIEWKNDFIVCVNESCSERIVSSIEYHFEILKVDLFGRKTVRKLVSNGFDSIESIYTITADQLLSCGFGAGQSANLLAELDRIKSTPINDYLLLASLGISGCGRGTSKRILKTILLSNHRSITVEHLVTLDGFAEKSASIITAGLNAKGNTIDLLQRMLNVVDSYVETNVNQSTPLSGKNIVFTGKMKSTRSEMEKHAEILGATVQSGVRKTTDYLIIGENVGATKLNAATKMGVKIITVQDYYQLISI